MSSSVIGQLRVMLGLDSAQFNAGLDGASSKASAFAKRMGAGLGAAAATAGAALAGMALSAIGAGNEIAKLSKVANSTPEQFQKWAAGAASVGIEQEKLADILKDTNDRVGEFLQTGGGQMKDFFEKIAPKVGVTAEAFRGLSGPDAMQLYVSSLEKAGLNQQEMTFYLEAMGDEATALIPLLKNGGAAMAEIGAKAVSLGAVLDNATVASLAATRQSLRDVGMAFTGFRNILGAGVAPIIKALADGFVRLSQAGAPLGDAVRWLAANMQQIAVTAGVAATAYGTVLVAAFVRAQAAALMTAFSMAALGKSFIKTGIGALIVGAGYLASKFVDLIRGAGGFGAAMGLLRDLVVEVWSRMAMALQANISAMKSVWFDLTAMVTEALASIIQGAIGAGNRIAGAFVGAYEAIKVIWGALPAAIGSLVYGAANAVIAGVEAMINGVTGLIDQFITKINDALGTLPSWATGGEPIKLNVIGKIDLGEIENPYAGAVEKAGSDAAAAFLKGYNQDMMTAETPGLDAIAAKQREFAGNARVAATAMSSLAGQPLQSWQAIKDAVAAADTTIEGATVTTDQFGNALGNAADGGGKKLKKAVDEAAEAAKRAGEMFKGFFSGIISGSTSAGEAISKLAGQMLDQLLDRALSPLTTALGGFFESIMTSIGLPAPVKSGVGANANGTNNWQGGLTWVGERGKELVNLPQGSRVINNRESMKMLNGGGGNQISQTFTIQAGYGDNPQAIIAALRPAMQAEAQRTFGRLKREGR